MNRGEYWLLEAVVEFPVGLSSLVHPQIEVFFNKPGHNMERGTLIGALRNHFTRGHLIAFQENREPFVPTASELDDALHHLPPGECRWSSPCYGLTAKGGAMWEALAQPDWRRYLSYESSSDDDWNTQIGEVTCADRLFAQQYISGLPELGIEVLAGPSDAERVAPWQATYWKTLPEGFRFHFRCRDREERVDGSRVPRWFTEMEQWYVRPELDATPPRP